MLFLPHIPSVIAFGAPLSTFLKKIVTSGEGFRREL